MHTYNFGPWSYLQLPLGCVSAFARASLDVGSAAEIYGQAPYADYTADTALAPTPTWPIALAVTNPYLPAEADDDPPLVVNSIEANTDPSEYDVLGRRYDFNSRYRF
jgi:hypothetical protein